MLKFLTVFAASYLWHGMGTTIGYHRLLSHRSFKCPKLVEYFWVAGGYLAFEGSPIWWSAIHRAHHKYTDTPLDPHSPRYGLKNAYYGWMTHKSYPEHIDPKLQCPDLVTDPVYRFLDQGGRWGRAHALAAGAGLLYRLARLGGPIRLESSRCQCACGCYDATDTFIAQCSLPHSEAGLQNLRQRR